MDRLLAEAWIKGAVTVGLGYKMVNGKQTKDIATVFGVPKKQDVPSSQSLAGVGRDIVEVGTIRAQPLHASAESNTGYERPCRMGNSIGHHAITAGTAGCVVRRNGIRFILSNNHVLANCNEAEVGDVIYQPGPFDGGTVDKSIGTLHQFIKLHYMDEDSNCKYSRAEVAFLNARNKAFRRKTRLRAIVPNADFNLVDAAICLPYDQNDVLDEIIDIGFPVGHSIGKLGMQVQKSGRTTGYTTGEITQVGVACRVEYGAGRTAIFEDQLMMTAMSEGGDSGSAVLNRQNSVVGLLFAGSTTVTICNRIENVFKALNITL